MKSPRLSKNRALDRPFKPLTEEVSEKQQSDREATEKCFKKVMVTC